MNLVEFPFYARLPLVLLSVLLIYIILSSAAGIFIPLTFALVFAVLLYPFAQFLEKQLHFSRAMASITAVLCLMVVSGCFIYFLTSQFINFADDFPMLRKRFDDIYSELQHYISRSFHINKRDQTDYINNVASSAAESIAYSLKGIIFSISTFLLYFIFVTLFTFFILFHRRLLNKFVLHLFSEQNREKVSETIVEAKYLVNGYISALMLEMALISIVNCTMFFIMGNKYALLLGTMAALLNIIPYIGIYTSMVICFLVTFANSTFGAAIETSIGLFIVHLLDSNVLMPRLVGGRVKMNPFITILAVMLGEFIWGVPGMFLFIPIVGIIKLVCERVDGLEAWSILIGVDEATKKDKSEKVVAVPPRRWFIYKK